MTYDELDALLLAAEAENKRGANFANAEKLAREAIQHLVEDKTSAGEALLIGALIALSESLWRRGLAKDALPVAEQALTRSKAATGPRIKEFEATALRNIGTVYWDLSRYAKALEYFEKALAIDEELGNKAGAAGDNGSLGAVYLELSQHAKALKYCEKALAIDGELGNKIGVARHTGNIGLVYLNLSQYAKALDCFEKALAIVEDLGNKEEMARQTNNIGIVYANLSQYAKALEYYEKALAIDEELGHKNGVARQTGNIGNVYINLSQYPNALEYLEKALAIEEELGNKAGVAIDTGNIGLVYSFLSQYAKALEYCEKAHKLAEDIGDRRQAGYWLYGIGVALRKMGRNKDAMEHLQHSLRVMREEIETDETVAAMLVNIGSLLAEEGQIGEAIEKLEEGLQLAKKLGEKQNISEAYKELADVYAKQGDKAKAFDHFQEHYKLKEEIFSDDTLRRVEAFSVRVTTAIKERDLKLAVQEKELAQQEKDIQQLRADNLQQQVAMQASAMAAQADLLERFRSQVISVFSDMGEPLLALKKIKEKLHQLPQQEIDFQKIEADFASAHPEFRAKLADKFPTLTATELKICILFRMELKSHEAARLLSISERTVEKHRQNIREKLPLKNGEDLAEWLKKFDRS